jgi:hypothetical protein
MDKSFKSGILMGLVGPLAFLTGSVYWVYRYTRKVPFPIRRSGEGEIIVRLIEPSQVPAYWEVWKQELAPLGLALSDLCQTIQATGRAWYRGSKHLDID